ncbi:Futalosine hydrolase [Streptomyces hundungensis]|uniref:Futalosine hydrolase n=1 Tax=Streptomyces hundungensis TaxID=1077946 RepID=A0A387HFG9_9ACTN|nr:futalosine hydrolase [Streptomyces hundungensis]AYG81381.1 Futalosine hydrolase [Streptomyces hundungensis]
MRVLVVTAVAAEADSVAAGLARAGYVSPGPAPVRPGTAQPLEPPVRLCAGGHEMHVLPAGVGPAAAAAGTALALGRARYDLVVSAGIGGGFAPVAPLGTLVVASNIVAADLGAESPEGFLPVTALGFGRDTLTPPAELCRAVAEALGARSGPVLTVSTATGTARRTAELLDRHPSAVAEAMEGFGVAEAAAQYGVEALEIRAVSNSVGPRDRSAWRIGDALAALTDAFGKLPPVLESWTPHEH